MYMTTPVKLSRLKIGRVMMHARSQQTSREGARLDDTFSAVLNDRRAVVRAERKMPSAPHVHRGP